MKEGFREFMSDIMYNDAPNWKDLVKSYAVVNDTQIKGFFGDYRWLSNFYPSPVYYEGIKYPSVENAYQAAKLVESERNKLVNCSAAESKKLWKNFIKLNESAKEWDARKYQVMAGLIFDKFLNNLELRELLLHTGQCHLEETNHWHDNYWGVCVCPRCHVVTEKSESWRGENNLGYILMQTRMFWQR